MLKKPLLSLHVSDLIHRSDIVSRYEVSAKSDELCSLEAIWKRANRSNSWGYSHGLVPMFDNKGARIPSKVTPPWPWVILPDPVIKVGKKQWLTSTIDLWFAHIRTRADGSANATANAGFHEGKGHG